MSNGIRPKVLTLAGMEPGLAWVLFLNSIFLAGAESVSIAMILPIIEKATGSGGVEAGSAFWSSFTSEVSLQFLLFLFLGFVVLRTAAYLLNVVCLAVFSERIRCRIAIAVSNFSISSLHEDVSRLDLLNIAMNESSIASKLVRDCMDLVINSLIFICVFMVLVFVNWQMAALFVVLGALLAGLYRLALADYSYKVGRNRLHASHRITGRIKQVIDASFDLNTLKPRKFVGSYFQSAFAGYGGTIARMNILKLGPARIVEVLVVSIFVAVMLFPQLFGVTTQAGMLSTAGAFFIGMTRLGGVLAAIYGKYLSISSKAPSLDVVFRHGGAVATGASSSEYSQEQVKGKHGEPSKIQFLDIAGSRPDGPLIEMEAFSLAKGGFHAIDGESGAGKTTACFLLSGILPAKRYHILAEDLAIHSSQQLREHLQIAYVPQNPVLFDMSIRENLQITSARNTTFCPQRLLELVGLADWSQGLAEGVETGLGDRGVTPSGGQGKRLALARALASQPDVLILDEPTSGLDEQAEARIIHLLEVLSQTVFVIVVTHSDKVKRAASSITTIRKSTDHKKIVREVAYAAS